MKKYFTILLFLCCAIPLTVYAAEMLNTKNSFQLARAVKLGRGQTNPAFLGSDFVPPEHYFVQQCADHCSSCNQENGVCSGCDSGYKLVSNKCIPIACSPGNYFNGSACSSCPAGQYSAGGSVTSCTACPAGTYASGTGNASCNTCSAGTYSAAGAAVCTNCPTGCTACTGANACTACASGYHIKNGVCVGNCADVTCASGANPVSGDKNCCCVAGNIANCAAQNGTTCTKCNSGYYLSGNSCVSCPSNATCTGTALFTCNSGYYKSGNGCVSCPANSTCTSSTSFTCNSGYYKNGSVCSSCSSAIEGCSACTSATNCTACSGTFYHLSNGACIHDCDYWSIAYNSCSQGYRKPVTGGSCEKCPANTQCGTCPSGCSGSSAGTCSSGNISCIMCHNIIEQECRCPSGYKPTLDGTSCVSTSGTGWPQACTYI